MKLIKCLLISVLAFSLAVSLTGCVNSSSVYVYPVEVKNLEAPIEGDNNLAMQAVATGANDFAFRLTNELLRESGSENFVCSPLSVWLPLAALANAADEAYRDELLSALGAEGASIEDLNRAASRMMYDLTKEAGFGEYGQPYTPMQIADAVFVNRDLSLTKEFAQAFMDYYRGQAMAVDFTDESAVDTVNEWARDHTEGIIKEIIQKFEPDTAVTIANAIYYSDRWDWEFDPQETTEDVFHATEGDYTASYMLREGDNQLYYEDDRLQAMPLRFKSGGSLYILLPKDGDAAGLLSSMNNEYFTEIQNNSVMATGKLLLPKFAGESTQSNLTSALETLLGTAFFDPVSAPFTGLIMEGSLYISKATQKAVIELDEKGATAAAVTVIEMPGAAVDEPEPFEMICNRPFAFILVEDTSDGGNQILFTGVVNNPQY